MQQTTIFPTGSPIAPLIPNLPQQAQDDASDPFFYYSNDSIRMKELLLKDDVDDLDDHELTEMNSQSESSFSRKTRLSFEVHPNLIYDDFLNDLYSEDEDEDGDDEAAEQEILDLDKYFATLCKVSSKDNGANNRNNSSAARKTTVAEDLVAKASQSILTGKRNIQNVGLRRCHPRAA